ncbi:MAG: HEAT repeat domain-containing protein [Verrucomicrobia bacterium]|nr:HEAT repeat domain-containing protein [Verrucomicrobiota bacterium]
MDRLLILLVAGAFIIGAAPCWAVENGTAAHEELSTARLVELLRDKDPGRVSFALYQLAARSAAPGGSVVRLCGHTDPYVRRAAFTALVSLDEAPNENLIKRGLRDRDPGVRRAALGPAMALGPDEAVALFIAALNDAHPAVRELAAFGLARLGGTDAVNAIIKVLGDPSRRVRRAAVIALGALGDRDALEPLRTLQSAPEKGVDTKLEAVVGRILDQGHNFDYEFLTLPTLVTRFSADTGLPTFVTDEALRQTALAAQDPDNLDGLKVSMWHVKVRTLLDDMTKAAGLTWIVEGRWIIITVRAYAIHDTPIELEIAGALRRLGDASAEAALRRYANDSAWKARAEALLRSD